MAGSVRPLHRRGTGGSVPRLEKVEPGDGQLLEHREQGELDGVPSFLALRDDQNGQR